MIGRLIDSFIGVFNPRWGAERLAWRAALTNINNVGGGKGGYQAAKLNRLTQGNRVAGLNENAQPRGDIRGLRVNSWELFRNCPQAKKACRTLQSKIIGRGLRPQSQATQADGTPHIEFRKKAAELWRAMHERMDYRGRPGNGGQDFTQICNSALLGTILGGEILFRYRSEKANKKKLPAVTVQLVHADRLDDTGVTVPNSAGNVVFAGIELDPKDRRAGYHVWKYHPSDPRGQVSTDQKPAFIKADEMGHLYIAEDVDQLRGTPWFSAALQKMTDTNDYEFTELTAAKVAACVVYGYSRSSGQSDFGLAPATGEDTTDADGNKLNRVQPGMILDLGRNGKIEMVNPMRPNANVAEFVAHMLRSQATALPGVKGSTLTGDFRNSSFSSERSADNDIWPELETLQDWFAGSFCQPIYEKVVTEAVVAGYFTGVVTPDEFEARKDEFLRCGWQGPVARSINPTDDAEAARKRIQNGQSSPQREAALIGRNWQEIVMETAEYIAFAESQDIPESVISQTLGIDQQDDPMGSAEAADTAAAKTAAKKSDGRESRSSEELNSQEAA